jgi:hypothetical protein
LNQDEKKFDILETTNLRLFVGGGVHNEDDQIREAFSLLNNTIIDIKKRSFHRMRTPPQ